MKKQIKPIFWLSLLIVLAVFSWAPAQINNPSAGGVNPTSTILPYNNAGVLADSPIKVINSTEVAVGPGGSQGEILLGYDSGLANAVGVLVAQAGYMLVKSEAPIPSEQWEPGCQFLASNSGIKGGIQCLLAQGFGGNSQAADQSGQFLVGVVSSGTETDYFNVNTNGATVQDHLNQGTVNNLTGVPSQANKTGGSCAMSSATTCTFTMARAFTATPLSYCSIDAASTVPATANSCKCAISATTATITAGISNSLTWDCIFLGNPN